MKTHVPCALRGCKVMILMLMVFLLGKQLHAQAPANDQCSSATLLTSSTTCNTITGDLANATVSVPTVASACTGTPGADVWYSFVAQSVYPTIALSSTGTSLSTTNARIQLFSGVCGGLTALGCTTGNLFNTVSIYPTGLTPGTTYYIRIYSATVAPTGATWGYSICVTDPPANDLCANAVTLTSSATCTPTAGTLNNAAISVPAITGCGTTGGDVWYTFVAQSVYPTITLSGTGVSVTAATAHIQLFSGTCGSLTSLGCVSALTFSTASAYPTGLTPGTTYYIRVYSNTVAPTGGSAWDFSICVADAPVNDLCSNATPLTSGLACTTTPGTLNNAAISVPAVATTCGTAGGDVWYSFVAQSVFPTITLSSTGTSLGTTNARIQLLSGTCGSLTSLGCVSGNVLNSVTAYPAGLTPGTTYYIRIYSNTAAPTGTSIWNFSICVTDPPVNDLCSNATPLTSNNICNTTAGTLNNAAVSSPAVATTCGTAGGDVWYSFVAQSTYPTITLSSLGTSLSGTNARIQLFSGSCGSLSSLGCVSASSFNTSITYPTGLILGTTYYIRIYSNTLVPSGTTWDFAICVTDPPVNDVCANAIALTSAATCSPTAGTVGSATYTAASGGVACTGTDKYDVWYTFVAQRTNPTITLGSIGTAFVSPRIQVLSNTCGSFTSIGCSTGSSYTPTGLTIGNTYYVRVYSIGTTIPNINADFTICITDPPVPANDNCSGATTLTSATACSNTAGTLLNSTATAGVPGDCGAVGSPEVWYQFVAQTAYPIINLSSVGAQFTSAGPRIQLLSGTCGSFTSIACVSATSLNTALAPGGSGLTIGSTYYVRIYTNSAVMSGTTWGFNICITDPVAPTLDYGKSYFNVTKGTNGGTIEPGDTLEIRANFVVKAGAVYLCSFNDNLPSNTTYIPNTLRILTNEGQLYKQWTDAADGDPGTISGSVVTINLGTNANATSGGYIKNTDRPTLFGGTCMVVASYRVVVSGTYGDIISVGNGNVTYTKQDATTSLVTFPTINAVVYKNYGICANTVGTNAILSESGGTFGSGNAKDRVTASGNIPSNYTYIPFSTGTPQDYYYGISNNTSPSTAAANYSITNGDPVLAHHVFNVWDIIGDHTGASDPLAGNPAADVNSGAVGGYMVVINAAFRTDTAFLDTVRNLCPNTSYEYSAWFRNMCHNCSGDSTGKGPTAVGYVPTAPGDSSGVHPNLTFNINGYDYYTTGDIVYTGQWIKKGFTYRTGPSETQMIINIRNNAPGGGGNDWAIDDIGVATCSPTLNLNPSTATVNVCYGDGQSLSADVTSYFDNYTYYSWEKSVDGGATFTTTPFFSNGTIVPTYTGSNYTYTATGPSFIGDSSTNLNIYRLRVATSPDNIADTNCSFLAVRTVQVLVNNCLYLLKSDLINATASLHNNLAAIQWQTVNESDKTIFEIEKSTDGSHFIKTGTVNSNAVNGAGSYVFNDPATLTGRAYYRIKMIEKTGYKYSKMLLLSTDQLQFAVKNLVNPFASTISCNVILPADGNFRATVFDMYGRAVKTYKLSAEKGVTPVKLSDLGDLSSGTYFLKVEWQHESIIQKIIKANQ